MSRVAKQESVPASPSTGSASLLHHVVAALTLVAACAALVGAVEAVAGRPHGDVIAFVLSRAGLTTVATMFLVALGMDMLLGRAFRSIVLLVPAVLLLAFISYEKQQYLSDPLYPSDLLFARQITQLLPVMVRANPVEALALGALATFGIAAMLYIALVAWHRFPALSSRARLSRLLFLLPFLLSFTPMMNVQGSTWLRDRMGILPMMWDQKANYRHNGFLLAFALNIPMSRVAAPQGYSPEAIADIPLNPAAFKVASKPAPDVIMIMSESLWDPTKLENVGFNPDPMPTIRDLQTGQVFSPEFGGMTANVEFEALTGFSNAFLPYGGIPYQQYVRRPLPSLAGLFRDKGYTSVAVHPFEGWFWNRENVYRHLGFDRFLAQEQLPSLEKRGMFASDTALTEQIIQIAEGADLPLFLFAVTLQGHGPYEAGRYMDNSISIESELSLEAEQQLATYSDGVKEADDSLAMLMEWAKSRQRETIIILFGDHLPPLGKVFMESGYMKDAVATRRGSLDVMKREHETPLVIWSSKTGARKGLDTISPSVLPYHVVSAAGFSDPFYTGLLGEVAGKYAVIDRYMLVDEEGRSLEGWNEKGGTLDRSLQNYRLLQYDMMFGDQNARGRFFPFTALPPSDDGGVAGLSQVERPRG
ncbi:MAG TPA: LTA synthase family protein [Pseudorhizobium sp.]|nr:LTA synthase family protein [Pseudorhizobium sp.]